MSAGGRRARRAWPRAAALVLLLGACATGAPPGWPQCARPVFDTQGHRGARGHRPENTLPAMEYALARGVRTLEMDLSVTRDDVLVLSHDPRLAPARCLGPAGAPARDVPIRSLTLAELRTYDCGALRHPQFPAQVPVRGTPPPTLAEVFALAERLSGGTVRYSIEPKTEPTADPALAPAPAEFARLLERAVAAAGVADRVLVESFDPRMLAALQATGSRLRTSLLVGQNGWARLRARLHEDPVEAARAAGAAVLSPEWHLVDRALVARAHARGLAVIPWTVNDAHAMERVIAAGVDGLISDDVDLMLAVTRARVRPGRGVCF